MLMLLGVKVVPSLSAAELTARYGSGLPHVGGRVYNPCSRMRVKLECSSFSLHAFMYTYVQQWPDTLAVQMGALRFRG
jgi:hypothetical protein